MSKSDTETGLTILSPNLCGPQNAQKNVHFHLFFDCSKECSEIDFISSLNNFWTLPISHVNVRGDLGKTSCQEQVQFLPQI